MTFEQASLLTRSQCYKVLRELPGVVIVYFYTDGLNGQTSLSFNAPTGSFRLTHYPREINPPANYDVIRLELNPGAAMPAVLGQVASLFDCKWQLVSTTRQYRLFDFQSSFMLVFLVLVATLSTGLDYPWIKDIKPIDPVKS